MPGQLTHSEHAHWHAAVACADALPSISALGSEERYPSRHPHGCQEIVYCLLDAKGGALSTQSVQVPALTERISSSPKINIFSDRDVCPNIHPRNIVKMSHST